MRFSPGNAQHIGARQEQQDAFAFSDPSDRKLLAHGGLLAVVSDGMGGLSNGQQASSAAVRTFLAEYERKPKSEPIPMALRAGLQAAFQAVAGLNQSPGAQSSGATIVAAAAHQNELYWVSVGDSRLYLLRRGHVVQLSRDHSYRERLFDQVADDHLALDDAKNHPQREHLTSYLGMNASPEVDSNARPFPLEPDDVVFLCTDGVYRALSENEFAAAFAGKSASQACEAIKAMVLARATAQQDNLTIVAFRCEGSAAAAPPPGLRSQLVLVAVGLMLCANLLAANLAWKTWRKQVSPATEQKRIGASPSDHDSTGGKPSPMPAADQPEPTPAPVGKEPVADPETAPPDTSESKPAGRDTAAPDEAPQRKHDKSRKNGRNGNHQKSEKNADQQDTRQKDTKDTERKGPRVDQ